MSTFFEGHAQDGRGIKHAAQGINEFVSCMAASIRSLCASKLIQFALLFVIISSVMHAQSLLGEINQEHNPGKRAELALSLADESFDDARGFYDKGAMEKGDAALENMTNALNACVQSLAVSNKPKFYKRAELKVAYLQRRMNDLLEEMSVQRRGWAEQTKRRLEAIHDKILNGVMSK
jgi:DNA gyrase/topoisomerase IV subunit B